MLYIKGTVVATGPSCKSVFLVGCRQWCWALMLGRLTCNKIGAGGKWGKPVEGPQSALDISRMSWLLSVIYSDLLSGIRRGAALAKMCCQTQPAESSRKDWSREV